MNALDLLGLMMSQGPLRTMKFLDDWQATMRMYYLYAAIETGLLKALTAPRTRAELIDALAVKRPEILDALLDVGLAIGELGKAGDRIKVKGLRSRALQTDKDEIFTGIVQANVTYYHETFHDTPMRVRGAALADRLDYYAEIVARFSRGTEPFVADFLKRAIRRRGPLSLLEIGCGSGIHLRTASVLNPAITGFGLDVDTKVATQAERNLAEWGLSDRFHVSVGDIRNPPPEIAGPFDVVTLFNNIYYFPVAERPALFKQLRGLTRDTGRLLLATFVASRGRDAMAAALNLATSSEHRLTPLPDEDLLAQQLREAGFHTLRRQRLMPRSTLLGFTAS
jgi:4-hydroxy-2,2'-bipyrrole-5-carbaldehyde O-methyltransferase